MAAAAAAGYKTIVEQLPDHSNIFSAEGHAVNIALDVARKAKKGNLVILTLSCMEGIENKNLQNPSS